MKRFILAVCIAFTSSIFAQQFEETTFYATTFNESEEFEISLHLNNQAKTAVTNIDVTDMDVFDQAYVYVLENPTLANVDHIIKVDMVYIACCSNIESHYFIVKNDQTIEALPMIENAFCFDSEPKVEYQFPNQENGKDNCIVTTKSLMNDDGDIVAVQIEKAWLWNVKEQIYKNTKLASN